MRMYQYQRTNRYFAQTADDTKLLVNDELQALGADDTTPSYRGVYFSASPAVLYRINYCSRLAHRILAPLITFNCHSDRYLYKTASQINWSDFFDVSHTFAIDATVSGSNIRHSRYAAQRLKDAIVDQFRERNGRRPSVNTIQPDVWIHLHIRDNRAVISIDTAGGSLHRRGYRRQTVEAPMLETLAAAIISLTEWDYHTPLYDPFCGSGTLLCEAWIAATHTPPGKLRQHFGFQQLPDYDEPLWKRIKNEADSGVQAIAGDLIAGSDISSETIGHCRANCRALGANIQLSQHNIFELPAIENKWIVCNPPYGIRLQSDDDLSVFYRQLGDFLKQRCKGSTAFIYFGNRTHIKRIGLKPAWKLPLRNGGLDGRLVRYDLY